ncbi:MAG: pyridoxamine 5'-phosphate oxidase family protein [Capsulimonadaceae bacterium]|nr:pyridoxamine 5'-phosphate oxidase family protein [Capsulimonadaceae bacterium]
MRREDRSVTQESAVAILTGGHWGVLSLADEKGQPYGVPISYAYEHGTIYIHCALDGRKLDCLRAQPRVSFCVVDRATTLPDRFSVDYASVIVSGDAIELTGDEKRQALSALVAKYSPGFESEGETYISRAIGKTRAFKITIESITGKARNPA